MAANGTIHTWRWTGWRGPRRWRATHPPPPRNMTPPPRRSPPPKRSAKNGDFLRPCLKTTNTTSEDKMTKEHVDLEGFIKGVARRNPGQPEFVQAVHEAAHDIFDFI